MPTRITDVQRKKGRIPVLVTGVESNFKVHTLAVLGTDDPANEIIVTSVLSTYAHQPIVFLYLGEEASVHKIELFRMIETHLNDTQAKDLLGRINAQVQEKHIDCRFIFRHQHPGVIEEIWQSVHPNDTIISSKRATSLRDHAPELAVKIMPDQTNDQLEHFQKV